MHICALGFRSKQLSWSHFSTEWVVHKRVPFAVVLTYVVIIHAAGISRIQLFGGVVRDNATRSVWIILLEEPRHERIVLWVIRALAHVMLKLIGSFLFALTKSEPEEGVGPSLFSGLLLQDILKEIFVALDETLTVLLPMLDLLLAVTLDALQEALQGECLFGT